eukprot:4496606-Pyramimonas_sp.AAC.1
MSRAKPPPPTKLGQGGPTQKVPKKTRAEPKEGPITPSRSYLGRKAPGPLGPGRPWALEEPMRDVQGTWTAGGP